MFEDSFSIALVALTLVVAAALAFLFLRPRTREPTPTISLKPVLKPLAPIGSSSSSSSSKRPAKNSGPSFKILFATQTGTAEEFASTIASEGASKKFNIDTVNVCDYQHDDLLEEKFVIFVSSTYGDGEPPDTAKEFFEWLQSPDREPGCLSGLSFTIFGLGDKTYEKFCAASRTIEERVIELGGKLIYPRGEGDNDGSIQEDFDQWKTRLWEPVAAHFGVDLAALENEEFKPHYVLKTHKPGSVTLSESVVWFKKSTLGENNINNPVKCTISSSRQLHSDKSDRSCLHVEINIKSSMRYEAGDHLGIYPQNPSDLVKEFAERINADLEEIISLRPAADPRVRPALGPCTVEKALRCYVNLSEIPSKKLLKVLADKFTSDPVEKERLLELSASSEKGWELYKAQVQANHLTTLEVLKQNPSCAPPLDHLLELMPVMQPRFYSISSCPAVHPLQAHVTAVVVEYQTPTGRIHKGVCTNYLSSLRDGDSLFCFTRTSNFKLPKIGKRGSVIMIGPGTGVAPFRGFIEQLSLEHKAESLHKNVLFFGCRARDVDFLYRDELEAFKESGILSDLFVAFSREQHEKVYVQHKLKENGPLVWSLLQDPSSCLYICGDARHMAKDVQRTLKQIAVELGGKTQSEADTFFTQLQTSNRMMLDIWT